MNITPILCPQREAYSHVNCRSCFGKGLVWPNVALNAVAAAVAQELGFTRLSERYAVARTALWNLFEVFSTEDAA